MATVPVVAEPKENLLEKLAGEFHKTTTAVESFLTMIGKDASKALVEVEKYLPEVSTLAAIVFPGQTALIANAANITKLAVNTVATIEAKYAASGAATGTGAQKLADALEIAGPATIAMLKQDGITANTDTVTQIVNKVVAILNLPMITGLTPTATA